MEFSNEKIYVKIEKQYCEMATPSSSSFSSSRSRVERIEFYFTCKKTIIEQYQDQEDCPEFVREREQPEIKSTIEVNAPQVFDFEKIHTTIEGELSGWDLSDNSRKQLVKHVLRKTQDILKSVSSGRDLLRVYAETIIIQTLTFPLSDAIDLMTHLSIEEAEPSLVPATDSSIESLEKKILMASDINIGTDRESCRVCLEEFSVGCQVACMPCSHMFHEGCIGNWLRTSHHCPICRFEMPMKS